MSFQRFSNRSNRHARIPEDVVPYSGSIVSSMPYCCRSHQSKYFVLDPVRGIDFLVYATAMYCRVVSEALLLEHPAKCTHTITQFLWLACTQTHTSVDERIEMKTNAFQ